MIKGVFLDLGWTILRPTTNEWYINKKFLEVVSAETLNALPPEKRKAAFYKAEKYLADSHLLFSEDEELEQFKQFYKIIATELPELGITANQAKEIAESKVYDMGNYVFFDRSKETILKLKETYKLGIISDTWPSADQTLKSGGIEDLFDTKTYSCHIGACKPDKRMYFNALERMGLPPEQTVFVDDAESNLDGAALCGIRAVLIKAKQHFLGDMEDSGKYPHIDAIEELPDLLIGKAFL
ncbi:MAG: HAD-IA family hydrolase [Oscillospiraceae bacterium]|nr:HAD-IA family hydrolase [Oscillospiraceae bacterium]